MITRVTSTGTIGNPAPQGATITDPQNHTLYMTVLVTPDMANFSGNVHGGAILKILDQVAYTAPAATPAATS